MKYLWMVILLCSFWTQAADRLMTEDEFTTDIAELLKSKNPDVDVKIAHSLLVETKDSLTGWQGIQDLTNIYKRYIAKNEDLESIHHKVIDGFLVTKNISKYKKKKILSQ